jgi:beta-glucosidase
VSPGTDVVQLYVSDTLEPGQQAGLVFQLDVSQLAFLDADMRWRVEAGEVDVIVGASSEDLRLKDTVVIGSDTLVDGRTRGFYAG